MDLRNSFHGIPIPDKLIPQNNNDYPLMDLGYVSYDGSDKRAKEIIDMGLTNIIVDTIVDRDNIPNIVRKEGLTVVVKEQNYTTYRLTNGLTNGYWAEVDYMRGSAVYGGTSMPDDSFGDDDDFYFYFTKYLEDDGIPMATAGPIFDSGSSGGGSDTGGAKVDPTLTKSGWAADAKVVGDRLRALEYVPIKIASFGNNVNNVELGTVVTNISFTWTLNKTAQTISFDDRPLDASISSYTLANQSITANKTWRLSVSDENNYSVSATSSVTFLNGMYWGAAAKPATYNSEFILNLKKELRSNRTKSVTVTVPTGQFFFLAIPTRFGNCTFEVGGFKGGIAKTTTIEFTNTLGYKENYDIYISDNSGIGTKTINIT